MSMIPTNRVSLPREFMKVAAFGVRAVNFLMMTTSSANNSVFRGLFEKQKLTGPNFIDWYRQLRIVLSIEDKLNYLEQPLPPAHVAPEGQQVAPEIIAAHNAWIKRSKGIAGLMIMTMEPEIQRNLENLHANDMLKELKTLIIYATVGKTVNGVAWLCLKLHEQTLPKTTLLLYMLFELVRFIGEETVPLSLAELPKVEKRTQASRDGCVIPRDGIFEIDLSNSYANESSIYTVSNKRAKLDLDSALLWHCRLGHISKKRIEKLQHDGLLNSTDLRAFEKTQIPVDTKGYNGIFFLLPAENKVFVAWNAEFLENSLITQDSKSTRTRFVPMIGVLILDAEEHEVRGSCLERQRLQFGDLVVFLNGTRETVGSKWLFKKKTDMDGAVHTYKARLVAKGYTQTPGIDYEETFSPVADIRAIRILIAIAAFYDYEIWQMDVKTAFLNGYLNEEVYMEQPEGFVNPKYPNRVCKLKRSIYGLKQASRQWNKRFDDEIKKFGFTQNRDEPCVYLKASGSNVTFLILYVDDILIMGNNIPMLQDVKSYLGRCFAMKDLGEAAYILGIKIYRDRSRRLIGLCQSAYIEKILKRYHMENSKRRSIPMQDKLRLSKSQGASTPAELKRMQNVPYASVVGSIMYVVRCTRPDVAFAQNITSRFQQNPGDLYWTTIKNILKYLRNTKDMFLVYGVYKAKLFATLSTEAEYITAYDASKEAVWNLEMVKLSENDVRIQYSMFERYLLTKVFGLSVPPLPSGKLYELLGAFVPSDFITGLRWLDLGGYEKMMKKTGKELDIVVDGWYSLQESDLENLLYMKAIIKEPMRLYLAAPLSIPHESTEDCIINGYTIPKGTRMLVNVLKIQHDPHIWTDPFEFQPERFLTSEKEIDVKGQHFELIPFGSGRRMCPVISFALEALSLVLANIIHGFEFHNLSNK
ncbi:retrotransposon protein, putative, ty1-copia subclass [Tanacetum coccineum]